MWQLFLRGAFKASATANSYKKSVILIKITFLISKMVIAVQFIILLAVKVSAHGFMAIPIPRMYKTNIATSIDSLRNPSGPNNLCKGIKSDGTSTAITLKSNTPFTTQLALSIGAEHVGTCSLELYNESGTKKITLAQDLASCTAGHVHDKSSTSKTLCPYNEPAGLVTNDMCLYPWTVIVPDLSGLDFNKGFMRWSWIAKHVTPNEMYETCSDVTINGDVKGAGFSGTSVKASIPAVPTANKITPLHTPKVYYPKAHKNATLTHRKKNCNY